MSFDASVSEVFVALSGGSRLHLLEEGRQQDGEWLEGYMKAWGMTLATLPPSLVRVLGGEGLGGLRRLVTAGEAADGESADVFMQEGGEVYFNAYGPTESSICATVYEVREGEVL